MIDDSFLRAMIAGVGAAVVAGPLGCFIVWRRMALFGGAMAHSALFGVALGYLLDINLTVGVTAATITVAVALIALQDKPWLSSDTVFCILAHGALALALGLIALSLMAGLRLDLLGYLFGDILAVTMTDIYWIYGGGFVLLAGLAANWRPLLAITVKEDLARAEGVTTLPVRLVFMILIAVVIALAMKIVGILMITSLLIIPAAARRLARTPEQMAVIAALVAVVAVGLGLFGSLALDTPSGPSIAAAATVLFCLSLLPIAGARNHAGARR